jgi:hypothetical protein
MYLLVTVARRERESVRGLGLRLQPPNISSLRKNIGAPDLAGYLRITFNLNFSDCIYHVKPVPIKEESPGELHDGIRHPKGGS